MIRYAPSQPGHALQMRAPGAFRSGLALALSGCLVTACAIPSGGKVRGSDTAGACGSLWRFDRLDRIGGAPAQPEGNPALIDTPAGKAVRFDGKASALRVACHPLAGAPEFSFEAIFRPDGGAFEQRWFHLAQAAPDGATDNESLRDTPRTMFEIRVVGESWYLDSFIVGPGYRQTLVLPGKLHPIGGWYHVAQTFDGSTYRSYVDGVLEAEAKVPFQPQGPGLASIGSRINRINYFNGAVYEARFSRRALAPRDFLRVPRALNPGSR